MNGQKEVIAKISRFLKDSNEIIIIVTKTRSEKKDSIPSNECIELK
jgi:hypothetical protein